MFDHIESFLRPRNVPEALRMLRRYGKRGRFVAGGTDLVVQADPSIRCLVDVTRLGLNYIRHKGQAWVIGSATSMAELERCTAIQALAGALLARAAASCGSVQNRHMATLGGNLANASPAADTATPLLVLDAQVVLAGARGRRKLALNDFFTGPGKTVLNGALLVEVVIPAPPRGGRAGWSFQKLGRNEADISIVNAAAGLQLDSRGVCKRARLALGAVGSTPLRMKSAENLLEGQPLNEKAIERAADEAARQVRPLSDVRASADYRREMSRVLARRALAECARQAGGRR